VRTMPVYAAIDLKSFYASVECVERGLDPLTTNLVVADESRTEKTICLAVSPSLKSYGIPGRPRLFEVVQRVREMAKDAPVFITGDFNVDQTNEIFGIFTNSGLLKDSYEAARIRFAENGTFNNFKTDLYSTSRIDHVFVSPTTTVKAYGVLTDSYWTPDETEEALKGTDAPQEITFDKYIRHNPSDHYPVFVRVKL
jgi:nucleotidyltransferase/DNA polymerase involved in DNA repair